MANLDPRIEAIRVEYGLAREDFWELPQKKGTWIAKHSALEMAAMKAKIRFSPPIVLEADGNTKCAALCVTGERDGWSEWSIGEASPSNNKNGYPFAMAEKRAKDRVILKLIGLHGLIYSEDEADDFKQQANANPQRDAIQAPMQDPDVTEGVKNWVLKEKGNLAMLTRLPDLLMWQDEREAELHRLLKKAPEHHKDLMAYYQQVFANLSKKEAAE